MPSANGYAGGTITSAPQQRLAYTAAPMRKVIAFVGLLGVVYALAVQHGAFDHAAEPAVAASPELPVRCDETALANAYRNHQSRVEVCGGGSIVRVLKDDTQGSRHQRLVGQAGNNASTRNGSFPA